MTGVFGRAHDYHRDVSDVRKTIRRVLAILSVSLLVQAGAEKVAEQCLVDFEHKGSALLCDDQKGSFFFGRQPSLLQTKVLDGFRAKSREFAGVLGRKAVLAITQNSVEQDVGHFRVAACGGLLSKSQSVGGPIRDEAGGGIGTDGLKASSFAQHDLLFHRSLRK